MRLGLTLLTIGLIVGCSNSSTVDSGASLSPTMQGPPEIPFCKTPITYGGSTVTITGFAQFNQRQVFGSLGGGGLGAASTSAPSHPAIARPIRYAEVRVTDSSGNVAQCATTQSDGSFSLSLPQSNVNYTVSVNSRSNDSHYYASVLNAPDKNQFYSLTAIVFASVSTSVGTLTALASGDTLGGAFNILDQILNANLYLSSQVGNCGAVFAGCQSYDPTLHKIAAYWQVGFNPNDYFGSGGGGLSFYLPGYSRLFILGGINGDTDNSDTDHFDNSVIIHEYGHFLEDNWLKTDSPGGQHDGDQLLDPRLAWSEGWGDFIQAAVRGENHYADTMGNTDGMTSMAFYTDTETVDSSGPDYPEYSGQGNFREFAVTRLLWDLVDDTPGETVFGYTDNLTGKFNEIWAGLTKSTYGFLDSTYAFRNVGLLHLSQIFMQNHPVGTNSAASDWTNIRGMNRHDPNTSHYAQYLVPATTSGAWTAGSCASSTTAPTAPVAPATNYYFSITPVNSPYDSGSLSSSDLFQNNRFYHLHIDAAHAGTHTLVLSYQDDNQSGPMADLDLYLYNKSANFAVSEDMLGISRQALPSSGSPQLAVQTESFSANLSAGDYLINVNVYTGSGVGTKADYNLLIDGVVLCPGYLVPP